MDRFGIIGILCFGLATTAHAFQSQAEHSQAGVKGAELISFDGINQLAAEASRVGMLSQILTYTLTIGPDGKPTECELDRTFRRKYIEIALCRPLLKHHKFNPARDASGQAVEGSFTGSIDFNMFFNQDGSSKARDW